jgi:iron complex outermembrane receptor protein
MKPFLLFIFTLLLSNLNAQTVKGTLSDNTIPVAYANVMLYSAKDSSLIKFTYSEDNGSFQFDQLTSGEYYIDATFIGLENYRGSIFTIQNEDIDLGNIAMNTTANKLAEVTVTAKKPLMEVKPDKVVLNVAGSVLATGDDALSLLRKAPGVLVDNNENITLLGKSGLIIYIDGKPSPLNAAELANMLKNMSSNDIESIEIISNPSAKYEAQGTAGIINIKRKKLNSTGVNGSASITGRQGKTFGLNTSTSLNYRNEKINLVGNASYFNSDNWNYNDFYRTQNNLGFNTVNENNNNNTGYNTKISGDYYLNKKNTLGFIAEYSADDFGMSNNSITKMGNLLLTETDSLLLNLGQVKAKSKNSNFNANYYFDGGNETTFNIDANYGRFRRDNDSYTPNEYTSPDRSRVTSTFKVRSITPTTIDIMAAFVEIMIHIHQMNIHHQTGQG